ncbi:hypothetical protein MTR_8g080740 [Medicago truncatula]|uniref:Uncharacterized protein n=1 Tax=Medicago truncatula TaxID=3880 RepID=A0A072TT53_MEDTR|nr:hypothetical protein MTR_8g080740 [Medicago truncatula]
MGKMVLSIIHRESARIWCRENKLISSNSRICHSPMKEVHSSLHPKIGNKDDVLWIKGGQELGIVQVHVEKYSHIFYRAKKKIIQSNSKLHYAMPPLVAVLII